MFKIRSSVSFKISGFLFDTTTKDVSVIDQLNKVYRYVKIGNDEKEKPFEIEICKTF